LPTSKKIVICHFLSEHIGQSRELIRFSVKQAQGRKEVRFVHMMILNGGLIMGIIDILVLIAGLALVVLVMRPWDLN